MAAYSSEPAFNNSNSKKLGTKGDLRTWLSSMKSMTYTKYTTLAPDLKAKIMEEYKKRVQTSRSTVIVDERKKGNTHATV